MDPFALNYSPDAEKDDGTCVFEGRVKVWFTSVTATDLVNASVPSVDIVINGVNEGSVGMTQFSVTEPECSSAEGFLAYVDMDYIGTQSFPYVIYQLWKFISPGLHSSERKHSRGFIIISSILFFIGVLFGYYIVTPLSLNFLANYSISTRVDNQIDISSYIALVRSSALASGLIFELPIIIYFLTKIGLVTPEILRKYRKYAGFRPRLG